MVNALTVSQMEMKEESRLNRLMKDERGLSLVELLAVVVILAIIAGIGVVAIGSIIQNSREDAAISNIQQAFSAGVLYQSTNPNLNKGGANSFTLKELSDAGLLDNTGSWESSALGDTGGVTFTIDQKGKLSISVPGGAIKAGQKSNTAFTNKNQTEVSNLTRNTLFPSGSKGGGDK